MQHQPACQTHRDPLLVYETTHQNRCHGHSNKGKICSLLLLYTYVSSPPGKQHRNIQLLYTYVSSPSSKQHRNIQLRNQPLSWYGHLGSMFDIGHSRYAQTIRSRGQGWRREGQWRRAGAVMHHPPPYIARKAILRQSA